MEIYFCAPCHTPTDLMDLLQLKVKIQLCWKSESYEIQIQICSTEIHNIFIFSSFHYLHIYFYAFNPSCYAQLQKKLKELFLIREYHLVC